MHAVAATCRPDERIRSPVKPEHALLCPLTLLARANVAEFSSICLAIAYDVCANRDLFALALFRAGAFPDLASWARINGSHNGPTSSGHAALSHWKGEFAQSIVRPQRPFPKKTS